jgi:hypothetical protein
VTNKIFEILLPTRLPIASADEPDRAAFKETRNSGDEVPNATIVMPTNSLEMRNLSAIPIAPRNIISAPESSIIKPLITKKYITFHALKLVYFLMSKFVTSSHYF